LRCAAERVWIQIKKRRQSRDLFVLKYIVEEKLRFHAVIRRQTSPIEDVIWSSESFILPSRRVVFEAPVLLYRPAIVERRLMLAGET
jgi:hypothetical protein